MRRYLLGDPGVCLLQALAQRFTRFPTELLLNQPIIGASSAYAGRSWNIANREVLLSNLHHATSQVIDGNHLFRTNVQWPGEVRIHEAPNALHAFVDVQKRTGLFAV